MGISGRDVRTRCQHVVARHHAVALAVGTLAVFCAAMPLARMYARAHGQKVALSPAEIAISAAVYVGFALMASGVLPDWCAIGVPAAGTVALLTAGFSDVMIAPALLAASFVFSVRHERTAALVAAGTMIAVVLVLAIPFGVIVLAPIPWVALAAAIGQAARSKRAHRDLLMERIRRAEEGKEEEARRRVQEERLRIARELHDAVGHHVALISVQAGAMSYLLDTDPVKARESLEHIQRASESALDELRMTVGLLRQPGDAEPVEPAGRLARLGELIDSFASTGLRVTCDVAGQIRELPEAVDLTAYRIIQESLTNTAKHAAGASARVVLGYEPGILRLTVRDDGAAVAGVFPRVVEEGHGIVGMRERAAAVGGRLTARYVNRGFIVLAQLPAPGGLS